MLLVLLKLLPEEKKHLKELCSMTGYSKKELLKEGIRVLYAKQKYGVDYPKLAYNPFKGGKKK